MISGGLTADNDGKDEEVRIPQYWYKYTEGVIYTDRCIYCNNVEGSSDIESDDCDYNHGLTVVDLEWGFKDGACTNVTH